jgi:hypothetical protein
VFVQAQHTLVKHQTCMAQRSVYFCFLCCLISCCSHFCNACCHLRTNNTAVLLCHPLRACVLTAACLCVCSAARLLLWLMKPFCHVSAAVSPIAEGFFWCRDMINTPAEDLSPQDLAAEAAALTAMHSGVSGCGVKVWCLPSDAVVACMH